MPRSSPSPIPQRSRDNPSSPETKRSRRPSISPPREKPSFSRSERDRGRDDVSFDRDSERRKRRRRDDGDGTGDADGRSGRRDDYSSRSMRRDINEDENRYQRSRRGGGDDYDRKEKSTRDKGGDSYVPDKPQRDRRSRSRSRNRDRRDRSSRYAPDSSTMRDRPRRDRSRSRDRDYGRKRRRSGSPPDYRKRARSPPDYNDSKYGRERDHDRDRRRSRSRNKNRDRDDRRRRRSPRHSSKAPEKSHRRHDSLGPSETKPPPTTTTTTTTFTTLTKRHPLPPQDSIKPSATDPNAPSKQKPNFSTTGVLAAETLTVPGTSITLKYTEPPEGRKPPASTQWRLYIFKDKDLLETLHLSTRSCWLFGREKLVADVLTEHPSCSKQHAVIQFRFVESKDKSGGVGVGMMGKGGEVKPYLLDLESANGSLVNGEKVPESRFVELKSGDVVKFGESQREYTMLLDPGE
ncbi:MAG: hypothetical protein M1834_006864 [Cirrosporium novae-zelandiae]|nr:MAG: hypothetical protein M1834_006864 [Cirrosporium novae-zelandiae]